MKAFHWYTLEANSKGIILATTDTELTAEEIMVQFIFDLYTVLSLKDTNKHMMPIEIL